MVDSPVTEPQDGDMAFYGKNAAGVLVLVSHAGARVNHWVTYVKHQGTWWCLDSVRPASFQRNPFHHQSDRHTIMQIWFKD